jgi:hypothetical protein
VILLRLGRRGVSASFGEDHSLRIFRLKLLKTCQEENQDDPPDLVIAGNTARSKIITNPLISHMYIIFLADTVVLTHHAPPASDVAPSFFADEMPDIFEKPRDKADNLRMLLDLNGASCEVVTGVSVVYPVLQAPGYDIK